MKTTLVAFALCGIALGLQAADQPQGNLSTQTSGFSTLQWNATESHWDRILQERPPSSGLRLGKSDFVVTSPLIEGFRRERLPEDASPFRRFTGLPVVRLFVPQKMPSPPGGTGRYFAWRDSDRPWVMIASQPALPPGAAFDRGF